MSDPSVEMQLFALVQWKEAAEIHMKATDTAIELLKEERNFKELL
jgi:hypothetical protein